MRRQAALAEVHGKQLSKREETPWDGIVNALSRSPAPGSRG
jgi:hypothetical protein